MAVAPILAYKLRAAAVSLAIFCFFAVILALVVAHVWYPDYLFWTDGGLEGLRIVLSVDFVLGPVMAMVFFHPEKSRRKLIIDIAVIATIQLSAMVWGALQLWGQRPVAIVYGTHRFISVAPDIMRRQGETAETLARFSAARPPYVYRRDPANEREKLRQTVMVMKKGYHTESQAFLFTPMREHLDQVFEDQQATAKWLRMELPADWERLRAGKGGDETLRYRVAFFEGRYANAVLLFTQGGDYAGYVEMKGKLLPDF